MTYESGLQALEPRNFSGPLWQDLTGIGFNVEELPHPDQYSEADRRAHRRLRRLRHPRHRAGLDPSMANGGVILPRSTTTSSSTWTRPTSRTSILYQFLPTYKGKRWGFFDDGDVFALYYRTDIFGDPKLQEAYKAKFNADLRVPQTWDEYAQVAQFITDQLAPNVYGGALPQGGQPGQPVLLPAAVPHERRQVLR